MLTKPNTSTKAMNISLQIIHYSKLFPLNCSNISLQFAISPKRPSPMNSCHFMDWLCVCQLLLRLWTSVKAGGSPPGLMSSRIGKMGKVSNVPPYQTISASFPQTFRFLPPELFQIFFTCHLRNGGWLGCHFVGLFWATRLGVQMTQRQAVGRM